MSFDVLTTLLDGHRFLPRHARPVRAAFEVLPELADGLPALVADARGIHILSGCADALRPLTEAVVNEAAYVGQAEDVDALERRLASDPLVALVASLAQEGATVSPAASVVPFLQTLAHASSLAERPPGDPEQAAETLARIALAVLTRLGAACARLEAAGHRVPALAEACAAARATAVFARGTLDRDPALPLLCGVLGAQVAPAVADAAIRAVPVALSGILARREAGTTTADDAVVLFRHLPPGLADEGATAAADSLSYDPAALALILPALARYTDADGLIAAGIEPVLARRLLDPNTGLAAAAALNDALGELQRWDVLSMLCAALASPGEGRRGLVVPRGAPGWGTAVAVGLGRLRADITRRGLDPGALAAIDSAWADATRGVPALCVDIGHAGLLVFDDALDATRFALGIGARMGANLAVGVGHGFLLGGTDGATARCYGAAVDAALRWVATAPLPTRAAGLGMQLLGSHGGWLCGSGVAVDAAAADALEEARVRRGLPAHGSGLPGGDPRVPKSLDLYRAFDFDDVVLAFLRVPGVTGGYEAIAVSPDEWRALLDREAVVEAPPTLTEVMAEDDTFPSAPSEANVGEHWSASDWDENVGDLPSDVAPPVLDLGDGPSTISAVPGVRSAAAPPTHASGYLPGERDEAPAGYLVGPSAGDAASRVAAPQLLPHDDPWHAAGGPAPSESVPPTLTPASVSATTFGRPAYDLEIVDDDPDPSTYHTASGAFADPFAAAPRPVPPAPMALAMDASGPSGSANQPDSDLGRPPAPALDFKYLLGNYAHCQHDEEIAFGRVLAGRFVDRHVYRWTGDLDVAYQAFLRDKVSAGFVPELDRTGDVPADVVPVQLDLDRLSRAWATLE